MIALSLLSACTPEVFVNDQKGPEGEDDPGLEDKDSDGYAAEVDCDDAHATVHPDAEEACDGVDNDCDGSVDEDTQGGPWYADADGDGYGDPASEVDACVAPSGYVARADDCDDRTGAISPDAAEACNGVDDDCDGETDSADPDLALSASQVTMAVTYCWSTGCDVIDWPLDPDGTWTLLDNEGTWTWDACAGAIEMVGGGADYTGTTADRVHFSGEMYSENNGEWGTWTGVLR